MKALFSGIQPTGDIHIGNYFGAIANWVRIQHDYVPFISIVDLHAITIPYETAEMPKRVEELALPLYACGFDLERTTLFVQSEVPGHADLTWIFNTITPLGELERMTQFKDKREQFRATVNAGLLDYPVLQAADILIYKGEVVPVGQDQKQHVEVTRDIAIKFNTDYADAIREAGIEDGQFFVPPEPYITGPATRVMSLRDGTKKMSKSDPSDLSRLNLTDDTDTIAKKIRKAKTDPEPLPPWVWRERHPPKPAAQGALSPEAAITRQEERR